MKAGELLAIIETPGLDQQLAQAKAALVEAQANAKLAEVTAQRWHKLLATQSVSQQDADVKAADAEAREAQVRTAQANVSRLEALEEFKKLVAPFEGIVTARRVDVGALVTADKTTEPERSRWRLAGNWPACSSFARSAAAGRRTNCRPANRCFST